MFCRTGSPCTCQVEVAIPMQNRAHTGNVVPARLTWCGLVFRFKLCVSVSRHCVTDQGSQHCAGSERSRQWIRACVSLQFALVKSNFTAASSDQVTPTKNQLCLYISDRLASELDLRYSCITVYLPLQLESIRTAHVPQVVSWGSPMRA